MPAEDDEAHGVALQLPVDTSNFEAAERDAHERLRLQFPAGWSRLPEMDFDMALADNLADWNNPATLADSTTVDPRLLESSVGDYPELEDSTLLVSRRGAIQGCRLYLHCMRLHRTSASRWRFRCQIRRSQPPSPMS